MKSTAKCCGWKLTGALEACEDCQMSDAQQKRVSKTTETQSAMPGERPFVDMSSVSKHKSLGGARVWLAAVDDATEHTWSHLIEKKSHAPKNLRTLVRRLNDRGNPVKHIRMDDAGELKKFTEDSNRRMPKKDPSGAHEQRLATVQWQGRKKDSGHHETNQIST